MRLSWNRDGLSYLGGKIFLTEEARYNASVSWFRTLTNLGFPVTPESTRLARFIRYGVLNTDEASAVLHGRLKKDLFYRYSLMCYYIDYKWIEEEWFYYRKLDWSWLDMENLAEAENITLFP